MALLEPKIVLNADDWIIFGIQAEQIEELNQLLEKHRDHVQKLETLLRMLDNETVDINQIKVRIVFDHY